MKKILIVVVALAAVAGCSQTEQGAAISGDAGGAIVGGLAGATVGALIGNANEPGKCYYRGRNGRRYIANC